MTCCAPPGYGEFFSGRMARRDARRYRRRGLDASGRRVVDFLCARGVEGARVLEVGGGIGAIQLELLRAGAASAENVELSAAYEEEARALAREAGLEERITRRLFDFAERPVDTERADVVILHKVVCCYPDSARLVGAAAERTRTALVLTFPRDEWWTRAALGTVNLAQRLRRRAFRTYVHEPLAVVAAAEAQGLREVRRESDAFWLFEALART